MARCDVLLLSLFLIAAVSVVAFADQEPDCVYTFFIETGSINGAGTDSIITAIISDKTGQKIVIRNLEAWGGLMGPGYDYYERGNVDIFSATEKCLPSPICSLTLRSDGSGLFHAWYVNYVQLTTVGFHANSARQYFNVEQWLESDTSLEAVRNNCPVSLRESVGRAGS
ncbi:hypothetical protein EUTSA_v10000355mg [Eutrema salsugineum]|uniref:PLAT domain-containing protein n=1 Tax=Eutrema salsugineum TaxID=72664 RepID=V4LUG2_EUTSA|nr:PLAT domain-containing protein 2 [Eutrema salsugineum]ESQ46122.1 hypothetical protein EUTSA_v10000355mg [Eutrema salsugineum]